MTVYSPIRLNPSGAVGARVLSAASVLLAGALALTACSSGAGASSGNAQGATTPRATGGGQGGGNRPPGVSGLIAAVNGTTMQVQTRTDQTAVSWTPTTTFSTLVAAQLTDVTPGACVTVVEPPAATPGTASPTPPTNVTAASVQIRPASNGTCAADLGGAGVPGTRTATGTRTAAPTPGAGQGNRGGGFGAVIGRVGAVSGSGFTVQETARSGATSAAPVTVTTTATTTYLKDAPATAADVKVGGCATAVGSADSTGAVTATSIALRPAANGACTGGLGGPGGAGGARTAQPTTSGTPHA